MALKFPPEHWERALNIQVIDPDGWRGQHEADWETPITKEEFLNRTSNSTARYPRGFFDQFK